MKTTKRRPQKHHQGCNFFTMKNLFSLHTTPLSNQERDSKNCTKPLRIEARIAVMRETIYVASNSFQVINNNPPQHPKRDKSVTVQKKGGSFTF